MSFEDREVGRDEGICVELFETRHKGFLKVEEDGITEGVVAVELAS
jgi:hypothetical protein